MSGSDGEPQRPAQLEFTPKSRVLRSEGARNRHDIHSVYRAMVRLVPYVLWTARAKP